MPLYLVQHGVALSKDIDPDRGLSKEGIDVVKRMADTAKQYHIQVKQIFHSGKKRTKQTAEIFSEYLKPAHGVKPFTGLNPNIG